MNKLIPLLAFSILLLVPVVMQNAFAATIIVNDQSSCESSPIFGTFNSGKCVFSGIHTVLLADVWRLEMDTEVTGTVDVLGLFQVRDNFSNSGTINVIGDPGGAGSRGSLQFVFDTDSTNECNGVINLSGGTGGGSGTLIVFGHSGFITIFNNFGTITGTNSDLAGTRGIVWLLFSSASPTMNNHGTITAPVRNDLGIFNDNLPNQCSVIGGEILPLDTTALLLANTQSFSWMIPVVLSGIGIGIFVVSRKS